MRLLQVQQDAQAIVKDIVMEPVIVLALLDVKVVQADLLEAQMLVILVVLAALLDAQEFAKVVVPVVMAVEIVKALV